MKYFLWISLLLLLPVGLKSEEPEIVIHLVGEPDSFPAVESLSVWDKDALQLTKLLRHKTRTQVLYQVDTVSSKDTFLQAKDGTRYALVQYGDNEKYRKFLFRAEDPQTLVTCAANVQDVLAVNKRYQVKMNISQKDFLTAFPDVQPVQLSGITVPEGQTLYRIDLLNPVSKKKEPHFLLFNGKQLEETFYSLQEVQEALQTPPNKPQPQPAPQKQKAAPEKTRKILLDGGTVHDQMYLPRFTNGENLPHLVPGKIPAGTPLWSTNL